MVGINHKLADLKLREQLAKTCQKRFGTANSVHGHHHFILLSTCNRTEVYFSSEDLALTHTYLLSILRSDVEEECDQKLYSYFGIDCFAHLIRVTTGLDSAILAETEIQGQVKLAYEQAMTYCSLPKELHFLFQKSLGISKKIRSTLQLGRGMPSLEHAIFNTGKYFFKELESPRILFVGASEINDKILAYLKSKELHDITICNRSKYKAQAIAEKHEIQLLHWEQLAQWPFYDWIVFGTKSPDYLIKKADIVSKSISQKLIIDLCVPRNVEPNLGFHPHITVLNIDQINRLLAIRNRHMKNCLTQAESMISHFTDQQTNRYRRQEQSKIAILATA